MPPYSESGQSPVYPQQRSGAPASPGAARGQAPYPAQGASRSPRAKAVRSQQRTQGMPTGRGGQPGPYPQQGRAAQYQHPAGYPQQAQQYAGVRHPYSGDPRQRRAAGYGAQGYGSVPGNGSGVNMPHKKKMRGWKKVLIGVGAFFLTLVVAGGGLAAWYISSLDSNMRGDSELMAALDGILDNISYDQGVYTLVLASDSRAGTVQESIEGYDDGTGRSDVIMLVRSDPATHAITLVSVPRDTPIEINGQKAKLNEAFRQGGATGEIEAVEQITGVSISHYVQVDFAGLERFIDTLGGIVVNVPIDTQGTDPLTGDTVYLQAGDSQRLNGAEALVLARARKDYGVDQDERRQFGVREMATAIIKEITSKSPLEMPGLISELSTCITSDVSTGDMATLASNFAGADTKIYSATGPSKGEEDPETGMWLCYENPEGWKNLMAAVEAGEDPSSIDVNSTAIIPE